MTTENKESCTFCRALMLASVIAFVLGMVAGAGGMAGNLVLAGVVTGIGYLLFRANRKTYSGNDDSEVGGA